jgi:hypothetical protein
LLPDSNPVHCSWNTSHIDTGFKAVPQTIDFCVLQRVAVFQMDVLPVSSGVRLSSGACLSECQLYRKVAGVVANQTYGKGRECRCCTEPCCVLIQWQNVARWVQFHWTGSVINV